MAQKLSFKNICVKGKTFYQEPQSSRNIDLCYFLMIHSDMSIVETRYQHIILNKDKVPIIAGTKMKVIELILDKIAYGWSPEELQYQHPNLTLGQIYSALAYYSDHQEELDSEIENQLEHVEETKKAAKPTPLVDKLRAKKLI